MDENELIDKNLKFLRDSKIEFHYTKFYDLEEKQMTGGRGKKLADLLKSFNLVSIDNYKVELTSFGREVCNEGGWLNYIQNKQTEQLKRIERQELEDKKLLIDYKQAKYNYRTRWIAVIGLGLAIFSAIASLIAIFKD